MIPIILAPLLAKLAESGLSLIGNAVLNKGKQVVEEKLGVSLDDALSTEEGKLKLQQLQVDQEEALLNLALENRKVDLEFYQLDMADKASARTREVAIVDSPNSTWLNKNLVPMLALGIICAGLCTLYFHPDTEVRMAAVSLVTMVISYYFGNSSSAWKKDSTISAIARNKE